MKIVPPKYIFSSLSTKWLKIKCSSFIFSSTCHVNLIFPQKRAIVMSSRKQFSVDAAFKQVIEVRKVLQSQNYRPSEDQEKLHEVLQKAKETVSDLTTASLVNEIRIAYENFTLVKKTSSQITDVHLSALLHESEFTAAKSLVDKLTNYLREYPLQDVRILYQICGKHVRNYLKSGSVNPDDVLDKSK